MLAFLPLLEPRQQGGIICPPPGRVIIRPSPVRLLRSRDLRSTIDVGPMWSSYTCFYGYQCEDLDGAGIFALTRLVQTLLTKTPHSSLVPRPTSYILIHDLQYFTPVTPNPVCQLSLACSIFEILRGKEPALPRRCKVGLDPSRCASQRIWHKNMIIFWTLQHFYDRLLPNSNYYAR